eukprot:7027115-Prymnesium_polylepis.1
MSPQRRSPLRRAASGAPCGTGRRCEIRTSRRKTAPAAARAPCTPGTPGAPRRSRPRRPLRRTPSAAAAAPGCSRSWRTGSRP